MTTQFEIDCALMAGRAYQLTRAGINWFPVPTGWTEFFHVPNDTLPTTNGFEAVSFQSGSQIVISFAGTYPTDLLGDQAANGGLATGLGSAQLFQAAAYYLQVKVLNTGAHITLTGHSLGGGLAALIGVFFGETAITFDQAPFAQAALFKAQSLMEYLSAETTGIDIWVDTQNGIAYSKSLVNGEIQLLVHKGDSNVLAKGWAADNLGITLGAGAAPVEPVTAQTYTGDQRAPLKSDGTYDWNATAWAADGTLVGGVAEANFNDVIYGSAGADRMDGLGGNDALDGGAGNDNEWRLAA